MKRVLLVSGKRHRIDAGATVWCWDDHDEHTYMGDADVEPAPQPTAHYEPSKTEWDAVFSRTGVLKTAVCRIIASAEKAERERWEREIERLRAAAVELDNLKAHHAAEVERLRGLNAALACGTGGWAQAHAAGRAERQAEIAAWIRLSPEQRWDGPAPGLARRIENGAGAKGGG